MALRSAASGLAAWVISRVPTPFSPSWMSRPFFTPPPCSFLFSLCPPVSVLAFFSWNVAFSWDCDSHLAEKRMMRLVVLGIRVGPSWPSLAEIFWITKFGKEKRVWKGAKAGLRFS